MYPVDGETGIESSFENPELKTKVDDFGCVLREVTHGGRLSSIDFIPLSMCKLGTTFFVEFVGLEWTGVF